ncbi:Hcp family type VI secretion system effector [Aquicoccus sp. G2-2]|uniref:Hcp family type VI secretion system effector n=1 Tax=Aquicoccus sp. G2-2 TaxID=3092120 RepID=UPI002AE08A9C|nr:type VI secretion system tube protein Hcp [Aquicoccus sp. G2-2]MEA1114688.1 type VI secretion system tube protein Hcp [Aquicoccus sp. G2-2]
MPFTGYMNIPDVPGESQRAEHEDEIDIHNCYWIIEQASVAQVGRGRSQSRAQISAFKFSKWYDASSPYLALATMQAKSFDKIVFCVRKDSGEAHLDYLEITMENVVISSYEMLGSPDDENQMIEEQFGLAFENVKVKYTVQADDHSAGDEHEIEYDIAQGV